MKPLYLHTLFLWCFSFFLFFLPCVSFRLRVSTQKPSAQQIGLPSSFQVSFKPENQYWIYFLFHVYFNPSNIFLLASTTVAFRSSFCKLKSPTAVAFNSTETNTFLPFTFSTRKITKIYRPTISPMPYVDIMQTALKLSNALPFYITVP